MPQSFSCPNCGAPLDYDGDDITVRCPYCNSSVIVPESMRTAPASVPPHPASALVVGLDSLLSQAARLKEILSLIRAGRKTEAVSLYRETFGVGLTEALEAVEKLQAGQPLVMPGSAGAPASAPAGELPIQSKARADIARLLREGKKIEAIKLYRSVTDAGLKASKDAVEAFEAGQPLVFAQPEAPVVTVTSTTVTAGGVPASGAITARTPSRLAGSASCLGTVLGLSFLAFWLGFAVAMVSDFGFTGLVRLAAPLACPDGYVDAYGERVYNFYDPETNTSVDGAAVLRCVDAAGNVTVAHPLLVFVIMFVVPWAAGTLLALLMAARRALRLPAALVPALGLVAGVGGCLLLNANIPSSGSQDLSVLFFGRSQSEESAVPIDLGEVLGPPPSPTPPPEPTPTPGLVAELWSIGGEGIGPGFFDDARYLGIDGDGNVYVGEHAQGSRVQVFDAGGEYVTQWTVDSEAYLTGLAADRLGNVYVLQGNRIDRYDAASGEWVDTVARGSFAAIAVTAANELVAVSDDVIVRFDSRGRQTLETDEALAEMVGEDLTVSNVAVDGQGNIYVTSTFNYSVFKFSPEGRFLDRFGGEGDAPGQFRTSPDAVAVDGQGRVYVGDFNGIQVFDPNGGYLGLVPVEGYSFAIGFTDRNEFVVVDRNAHKIIKYRLNQ